MRIVLLRRKWVLPLLGIGALALIAALLRVPVQAAFSTDKPARTTVIIDAGHGGEDGGAVSDAGVPESGINLQIARALQAVLHFCGQSTVMTRPDEAAVYSENASTIREKKVSDLHNRVSLIESISDGRLISIHQNSIPGHPSVHGAQVFYAAAALSDKMASAIQDALNEAINIDKARQCKQISSDIYLMKNVTCPAVLVECGFMSNRTEATALQEGTYQKKLAVVIAAGYLNTEYE
jgi:N-acetylmuramoyl-L-alanine amidase